MAHAHAYARAHAQAPPPADLPQAMIGAWAGARDEPAYEGQEDRGGGRGVLEPAQRGK